MQTTIRPALPEDRAAVELYSNARMTGNLRLNRRLGYAETGRRIEDGVLAGSSARR